SDRGRRDDFRWLEQEILSLHACAPRALQVENLVESKPKRLQQRGAVDPKDAHARGMRSDAAIGLQCESGCHLEWQVEPLVHRAAEHERRSLDAGLEILQR